MNLTQSSGTATVGPSRRWVWGVAALVAVAALGAGLAFWPASQTPSSLPPIPLMTETPPSPGGAQQPRIVAESSPPVAVAGAPQPVAVSPQPAPAPPQGPPLARGAPPPAPAPQGDIPHFDIVRVDPDGHAVLAGRAAPGSAVTVYNAGREVGRAKADAEGAWVLLTDRALPPGQSALSLGAQGKDGIVLRSTGTVALLVPPRQNTVSIASSPGTVARAESSPRAEKLSPPAGVTASDGKLSLDFIEYGSHGDVVFEGRAVPGSTVAATVGGSAVGSATADSQGKWRIEPDKAVDPGRYNLVIEEKSSAGKRLAAVASPFERATLPDPLPNDLVVVQPGNSLWRIARRSYGHGVRYVEIFHANRAQISNPRLIFPGQLLQIPGKT